MAAKSKKTGRDVGTGKFIDPADDKRRSRGIVTERVPKPGYGATHRGNAYIVRPRDHKWAVVRPGASRATGTFLTQQDAIKKARQLAKNTHFRVVIHGKDGRIRDVENYGPDIQVAPKHGRLTREQAKRAVSEVTARKR